ARLARLFLGVRLGPSLALEPWRLGRQARLSSDCRPQRAPRQKLVPDWLELARRPTRARIAPPLLRRPQSLKLIGGQIFANLSGRQARRRNTRCKTGASDEDLAANLKFI